MDPETLLAEGRPSEALAALTERVKKDPSDGRQRVFLFQLLAVLGQWERALNQLQVAAGLDPAALPMAHTYGEAIRAESFRSAVFRGERTPSVFGKPGDWVGKLLEALRLDAADGPGRGQALREQALEEAPATAGTLNGEAFEWVADADSRLGPILEVVMQGRYLWVPLEHVAVVKIEEPADLRDMVWTPAWFEWSNGGETVGLIPTRYCGSVESGDDAVLLSRKTIWEEPAPGLYHGVGQRILATDAGEYGVLDVRELRMGAAADAAADDTADG
jgi:type VI secretion system protein ImpE